MSRAAARLWQRRSQSRCSRGRGRHSPRADVGGVSPVPVQMKRYRIEIWRDVAGVSPAHAQTGQITAQFRRSHLPRWDRFWAEVYAARVVHPSAGASSRLDARCNSFCSQPVCHNAHGGRRRRRSARLVGMGRCQFLRMPKHGRWTDWGREVGGGEWWIKAAVEH